LPTVKGEKRGRLATDVELKTQTIGLGDFSLNNFQKGKQFEAD
jgi:hypothetical protein